MRTTLSAWWCHRGHRNEPSKKICACGLSRIERHAQVHASERAVVYLNPGTGEYRTPARADTPVPEVYSRQGYERHEIMNMTEWEREKRVVHEATNFNSGNEIDPCRDPEISVPVEVKRELIKTIADAHASGPWTGGLPDAL